jgi:hypothetical protein
MRSLEEVRWNAPQYDVIKTMMRLINDEIEDGDKMLVRIVAMLTKLCR